MHIKNIKQVVALTIVATCLYFLLYIITDYCTNTPDNQEENSLYYLFTGLAFGFGECFFFVNLSLLYNYLLLKTPILRKRTFLRLLLSDTLLLLMNIVTAYAITLLLLMLDHTELPYFNQNLYVFSIIVTFISGIYTNSWLMETANEAEMKNMKLDIQLLNERQIAEKAHADLLKMQIDPHFMFNNFSILSELIEQEPKAAVKFISKLSKIYRYVITNSSKDLVSISEELDFLYSYAYLIEIRYDNDVQIIVDPLLPNAKGYLPPVCMQLLVENAIKHNKYNELNPLHIQLYVENNDIVLQNELRQLECESFSTGIGIQNIINRYALLNKRKPIFMQQDNKYIVRLPIIYKEK